MYTYVHNLQGDIALILDSSGNVVVDYKYNAWGKPLSVTGSMAETLGAVNPFRYRGYVYDLETGLYYLRSRYYDCCMYRFITLDTFWGIVGGNNTHNAFMYCNNDPVNKNDNNGHVAGFAIAMLIVGVACLLSGCSKNNNSNNNQIFVGAARPFIPMKGSYDSKSPNCYSYAICSEVNEQPGERSQRFPTNWNDVYDVGLSIEADVRSMGKTIRVINGFNDVIADNEYRVAFRVGTKPYAYYYGQPLYDYHFMRQTDKGTWAEKHGTRGDAIDHPLGMNPENIPWVLGNNEYYDSPIIYYAIGE